MITGQVLVDYAKTWLNAPYMYGVNGLTITEALIQAKAKQYPDHYDAKKIAHLRSKIGLKAVQCNSFTSILLKTEKSANYWAAAAVESGPISTIPEIPGITVHFDGHMGIYIGKGKVLEARGTFYGVVITNLMDRPWKKWCKMPGIDYSKGDDKMLILGDKDAEKGGNMGTAVSVWQSALLATGFKMVNDKGEEKGVDGSFGPATVNGTADFQRAKSLPVTKAVDTATYTAMITALLALTADKTEQNKNNLLRAVIASAITVLEGGDRI